MAASLERLPELAALPAGVELRRDRHEAVAVGVDHRRDEDGLPEPGEAADVLPVGPVLPPLRLDPAERLDPQPAVVGGDVHHPADVTRRQQPVLARPGHDPAPVGVGAVGDREEGGVRRR